MRSTPIHPEGPISGHGPGRPYPDKVETPACASSSSLSGRPRGIVAGKRSGRVRLETSNPNPVRKSQCKSQSAQLRSKGWLFTEDRGKPPWLSHWLWSYRLSQRWSEI
jgi:hypothetical protein